MQLYTFISFLLGWNETMFYLNSHIIYLESISDLIKVYSSIEQQIAEKCTLKWDIPMKAQVC